VYDYDMIGKNDLLGKATVSLGSLAMTEVFPAP
jgi:hypothetical protein